MKSLPRSKRSLAPEVESKQLEFDVTTELTHSEVLCDKVKLNQILMTF